MKFSTLKRTKMTKNKAGKFYKPAFFTLDNFIIFKIFHVKHSSIKSSMLRIIKLSIPKNMTHLKLSLWNFPVFPFLSPKISPYGLPITNWYKVKEKLISKLNLDCHMLIEIVVCDLKKGLHLEAIFVQVLSMHNCGEMEEVVR